MFGTVGTLAWLLPWRTAPSAQDQRYVRNSWDVCLGVAEGAFGVAPEMGQRVGPPTARPMGSLDDRPAVGYRKPPCGPMAGGPGGVVGGQISGGGVGSGRSACLGPIEPKGFPCGASQRVAASCVGATILVGSSAGPYHLPHGHSAVPFPPDHFRWCICRSLSPLPWPFRCPLPSATIFVG